MLHLTITGHLGSDAQFKEINGVNYASFQVAHTEKDKEGNDTTTWVSVLRSVKTPSEKFLDHLKKGDLVTVVGKPKIEMNSTDGKVFLNISMFAFDLALSPKKEEAI